MRVRTFIFIVLALLFVGRGELTAGVSAARVRALELEIGAAMISPTDRLNFDKNTVGYNIAAELRYNFKTRPFDIGLRVDGDTFNRKLELNKESFKFRSLNAMVLFDLNINRKGVISPFLGVGIGGSLISNQQAISFGDVTKKSVEGAAFCLMPRVGVELFHRARVTLFYKYIKTANSHFGLSAGFVIGGGRK